MRPARGHKRWTPKDDEILQLYWGYRSTASIAKSLKRTPLGVYKRARRLGFQPVYKTREYTLSEVCRITGFGHAAVKRIIRFLGMNLTRAVRVRRATPHSGSGMRYEISQATLDAIIAAIKDDPTRVKWTSARTKVWGTGCKPAACLVCGTTERRHCGRGLCEACHPRARDDGTLERYPMLRPFKNGQ